MKKKVLNSSMIDIEKKDYTDYGYNEYLERPIVENKGMSALEFDSRIEPYSIIKEHLSKDLYNTLTGS